MSLLIYINGQLYPKEEAKISVYDHGLLYGDGVFEGIRSYGGKAFRLKQHIDRLFESAKAICLEIPLSQAEIAAAVNDTLVANHIEDGYVRLVVTRGAGDLVLSPDRTSDPQVIIIADFLELYPDELYQEGLEIITASTARNHPAALSPRVKSLNYLNNILATIEAVRGGYPEALMLNHKGEVAECTGDNIFLVKGGELYTPPPDAGILVGITRAAVIELASAAGIAVHETALTRHEVYVADECFLTGSAVEMVPVVKVDGRVVNDGRPGPVTRDLRERFHSLTRE